LLSSPKDNQRVLGTKAGVALGVEEEAPFLSIPDGHNKDAKPLREVGLPKGFPAKRRLRLDFDFLNGEVQRLTAKEEVKEKRGLRS